MKYILGKKVGMSQMFDQQGKLMPVTLVSAGPCYLLQKKTKEKDGYEALQIGFEKIEKKSKIGKSMKGKEYKHIKEIRNKSGVLPEVAEQFDVSIFQEGEKIKVTGFSKGKGFQGGVKRHGFSGRDATHGARHEERQIGSTGRRFPQHVMKGRKMPGRMGFEKVSVKNLKIMKIDKENNLLILKGAVPGRTGALLEIKA